MKVTSTAALMLAPRDLNKISFSTWPEALKFITRQRRSDSDTVVLSLRMMGSHKHRSANACAKREERHKHCCANACAMEGLKKVGLEPIALLLRGAALDSVLKSK